MLSLDSIERDRRRALEIKQRNQSNLSAWRCKIAWHEHNLQDPADPREPHIAERFKLLAETRFYFVPAPGDCFFVRYIDKKFFEQCSAFPDYDERPTVHVGVIEAEYHWSGDEPRDLRMRAFLNLPLGLGDAPGTARIVYPRGSTPNAHTGLMDDLL